MYNKDSFKNEFEAWKASLDEDQKFLVDFDHFDSSIKVLFLERKEGFEKDSLERLEETIREEDNDVRVGTFTRPEQNKLREDI